MQKVYLDNAATTAIRPEVIDRMADVMRNQFGNASSTHSFGRSAKALLEQCRKNIAAHLNAEASEIVFTSGGTEADNFALRSAVRDLGVTKIITSRIEHHAVLHTAEQLQKEYNIDVEYVKLDAHGGVVLESLEDLLKEEGKKLVSLMHINNEVGNMLNLEQVSNLCKTYDALMHSDTVQSIGHYKLDLKKLKVDYLAASAHKFHGPKGVGFCFVRNGSGLKPLIYGGEQERGYRAGTESIHNIVGMSEALDLSYKNIETEKQHIINLKQYFIATLNQKLNGIAYNGACSDLDKSTYTLVNLRLPISAEKAAMLQFQLDLKGIACSKGSACQSGSTQQSHVLTQLLNDEELKKPSIRFSFSKYNSKEELDYVIDTLCEFASC
ncbi:MAG: cysteine desulfurase [Bacteroidia bacterium]|nr:cysteine desulfurase [Bacteroidia bacterium]